jgi:hypothetical protein
MIGNERVRFCGQCELNVYNLSALTRTQAEDLIAGSERKLCVRFYRRRDGSIITKDCPVGLRARKLRLSRIGKAVAAMLFGLFAGSGGRVALHRVENLADSAGRWPKRTMGAMAEPIRPTARPHDLGQPVSMGRAVRPKPGHH